MQTDAKPRLLWHLPLTIFSYWSHPVLPDFHAVSVALLIAQPLSYSDAIWSCCFIQPPHTHLPTHTNRPATRQVYGFLFVASEHISLHVSYCISYFSNNSIVCVRIDICSPLLNPLSPPPPSSPLSTSFLTPCSSSSCAMCCFSFTPEDSSLNERWFHSTLLVLN